MRDLIKNAKNKVIHALGGYVALEEVQTIANVERLEPVKITAWARIESGVQDIDAISEMRFHLCAKFDELLRTGNIVKYEKEPYEKDQQFNVWRAEVTVISSKGCVHE